MPITESLLAHIHNDAFLLGSVALEGNSFSTTIDYLNDYLTKLPKEEHNNLPQAVKNLISSCRNMAHYQQAIDDPQLAKTIYEHLLKAEQDPTIPPVLVPGGYRAIPFGHALCYEFKYTPDGALLFSIHNSGTGLQYHKSISSTEKTLYCPVLTYVIPKNKIHDPLFIEFIDLLLKPQTDSLALPSTIRNIDYLYKEVFPKLHYWEGTITEQNNPATNLYTAGQISGTCSQHSLHQMLKNCFNSLDDYRQFIYAYKKYALDDYFKQKLPTATSRKAQSQLKKAIRHTLKLLNLKKEKAPTEDLFSLEQKKADLEQLNGYLSQLKKIRQERTQWHHKEKKVVPDSFTLPLLSQVPETKKQCFSKTRIPSIPQNIPLIEQMKWIKESLNSTRGTPLILLLEDFFYRLPLPDNYDTPLPEDLAKLLQDPAKEIEFYTLLQELQQEYIDQFQIYSTSHHNLPRSVLVKSSICAFMQYLGLHSTCKESYPTAMSAYLNTRHLGLLSMYSMSALPFAMDSPDMDLLLQKITTLKTTLILGEHRKIDYYQAIIKQYASPKELKEFTDFYEKELRASPNFISERNSHALMKAQAAGKDYRALYYFLQRIYTPFNVATAKKHDSILFRAFECARKKEDIFVGSGNKQPKGYFFHFTHNTSFDLSYHAQSELFNVQLSQGKYDLLLHQVFITPNSEQRSKEDEEIINSTVIWNSENSTQISVTPKGRKYTLLRKAPDQQLLLTIDYFRLHLDLLSNPRQRAYFEANLFQPPLLIQQLNSDNAAHFLEKFDALIHKGIHFYSKNATLSKESLFFIHMAFMVNDYAARLNPDRFKYRMTDYLAYLKQLTSLSTDSGAEEQIYCYMVLSYANECIALDQKNLFEAALFAHFKNNLSMNNDSLALDLDTQLRQDSLITRFKERLFLDQDQFNPETLPALLAVLGIEGPQKITIKGTFPIFDLYSENNILEFSLHLTEGLLYNKDGLAYTKTDAQLIQHPLWKQLGIAPPSYCFKSKSADVFLLKTKEAEIRFIYREPTLFNIQINWNNEGWYELNAMSKEQNEYLHLGSKQVIKTPLPDIMKERDMLAFVSKEKHNILFASEGRIQYCAQKANIHNAARQCDRPHSGLALRKWDEGNRFLCLHYQDLVTPLSDFEDPKFICVFSPDLTQSQQEGPFTIELGRYGLTLFRESAQSPILFHHKGKTYTLDESASLGNGIAQLCFTQGTESLCILPIQRFLSSEERAEDSEYYQLHQDISASIRHSENEDKKALQYSHSEQHFIYTMRHGKPIPETAEEALYLVYIYLGSNQPGKAWNVLNYCQAELGGLKGSEEELRLLQWILNDLPYHREKGAYEKDYIAVMNTPSFVATKLKALSLLTDCLVEERITALLPQAAQNFVDKLNSTVQTLYTNMQKMRRELPHRYTLSDDESHSLLTYCYENHQIVTGALGYEWVQLKLKKLKKEWQLLQYRKEQSPLSPHEKKREALIHSLIKKHQQVYKQQSKLKSVLVDTTIQEDSSEGNRIIADYILHAQANKNNEKVSFSLRIDRKGHFTGPLHQYFATYWHIAHDKKPEKEFQQLKRYCESMLIALQHEQDKNLAVDKALIALLYRLCHYWGRIGVQQKGMPHLISEIITSLNAMPLRLEVSAYKEEINGLLATPEEIWEQLQDSILPQEKSPLTQEDLNIPPFTLYLNELGLENNTLPQQVANNLEAQQQIKAFATEHLLKKPLQDKLAALMQQHQKQFTTAQKTLQQEIITLGNSSAKEETDDLRLAIDKAAKKKTAQDIHSLLMLYFHHNMHQYKAATLLSDEQIKILHQKLCTYVAQELQLQQTKRVLQCLDQLHQALTKDAKEEAAIALYKTLYAENHVDVLEEPDLSLFQLYSNMLLRTDQKESIARLLTQTGEERFAEYVEKMIMGGGKSKVLLPTLVQKKANGRNLVIVEVPKSLLNTNFADLRATSAKLFHQKARCLQFDRNSPCSSKHLEKLFNQLTNTMSDKGYLVTTADALQSIELKYLELLHQQKPQNESAHQEWEQQIYWAEQLVSLIRHRGDLIIDEVHLGLSVKNKLNYTLGTTRAPDSSVLKECIALFQFLPQVRYEPLGLSLETILKENHRLTEPEEFTKACHQLADALVDNPQSPLYPLIQEALAKDPQLSTQLKTYLKSQGTTVPEFVHKAPAALKNTIALYKEQVSELLPYTLRRKYKEHYGPSTSSQLDAAESTISIPYVANNQPKEGSRFGNYLEEINYTIQSMLQQGCSETLFRDYLLNLQKIAREELILQGYTTINQTNIAHKLHTLLARYGITITLEQLDLDKTTQLKTLYNTLNADPDVLYEVLENHVLKHIKIDTQIIHSDASNHVDLVRSCQGLSGTPYNHSTYHQRLSFATDSAKGLDDYIIQGIQAKKPEILCAEFSTTQAFIKTLIEQHPEPEKLHAIIDVSATFKGVRALEVAKAIATAFKEKSNAPQYILFFNEQHVLCALNKQHKVIEIGSSDPQKIQQALHCAPKDYFTFYDQAHSVGSDIKQSLDAQALVLIDKDTQIQNFLQGCMRMRQLLEGNQRVHLVLPPSMKENNLPALLERMQRNETAQLKRDNYEAVLMKMNGVVRAELMQRLLAIEGEHAADKKSAFFHSVQEFFIEQKQFDLFLLYGGLNTLKPTAVVFAEYKAQLLARFQERLSAKEEEVLLLDKALQAIIDPALKNDQCFPEQVCPSEVLSTQVDVQQENKKEQQQEVRLQVQQEKEPLTLKVDDYIKWEKGTPDDPALKTVSLKIICQQGNEDYVPDFSPNISATCNFYKVHTQQQSYLDSYAKSVYGLLFLQNPLRCILLSQEELKELSKNLPADDAWIVSTHNSILAGKPPEGIFENKEYQAIIEQVRYFNGECSLLIEDSTQLHWLKEQTEEKLTFLKEQLGPIRDIDVESIEQLKISIAKPVEKNKAFKADKKPQEDQSPNPEQEERAQKQLQKLQALCASYMKYALDKLGHTQASNTPYPETISVFEYNERDKILAKKYLYMQSLHAITCMAQKTAYDKVKLFQKRLNEEPAHILKEHRDFLLIRVLAKIKEVLLGLLAQKSAASFFTPPKANSERIEEEMKQVINPKNAT